MENLSNSSFPDSNALEADRFHRPLGHHPYDHVGGNSTCAFKQTTCLEMVSDKSFLVPRTNTHSPAYGSSQNENISKRWSNPPLVSQLSAVGREDPSLFHDLLNNPQSSIQDNQATSAQSSYSINRQPHLPGMPSARPNIPPSTSITSPSSSLAPPNRLRKESSNPNFLEDNTTSSPSSSSRQAHSTMLSSQPSPALIPPRGYSPDLHQKSDLHESHQPWPVRGAIQLLREPEPVPVLQARELPISLSHQSSPSDPFPRNDALFASKARTFRSHLSSLPAADPNLDISSAGSVVENMSETLIRDKGKRKAGFEGDIGPPKRMKSPPWPTSSRPQLGHSEISFLEDESHMAGFSQPPLNRPGVSSKSPGRRLFKPGERLISRYAFSNAKDFILNQPIFLSAPETDSSEMKHLADNVVPQSSLDPSSYPRFLVAECLEGTCEQIRTRIMHWLADRNRKFNLLWLYGPAGAGASSISRTIAKGCKYQGWLCATLFLLPNKQGDSVQLTSRIIPSFAYQLATSQAEYESYITATLRRHPLLLQEGLDTQFEALIWRPLLEDNLLDRRQLVIVLDGLDKCPEDEFLRGLICHIIAFAECANRHGLPFLWLVTSRREQDIILAFEDASPSMSYLKEELRIDTAEAKADVSKFLRHGFRVIHQRRRDTFPKEIEWPTKTQLAEAGTAASGLFAAGAAILEFVYCDAPADKWEEYSRFLREGHPDCNPLASLYVLYEDIIDKIPEDVFPTTKKILTFTLESGDLPAEIAVKYLYLSRALFCGALRRLHSVLEVPKVTDSWGSPLHILHKSFEDFLKVKFELEKHAHHD